MKLPRTIQGIEREGRSDVFGYTGDSGVEPLFIGSWAKSAWKGIKKVARVVKPFACMGCGYLPNPAAQIGCRIACSL